MVVVNTAGLFKAEQEDPASGIDVRLSGEPLTGHAPLVWSISSGVRPFVGIFELTRQRAERIIARGRKQLAGPNEDGQFKSSEGPLELVIKAPGHKTVTFKNLYLIGTVPGNTPYTLGVRIADQRWLWSRRPWARDYNIRRRTGENRMVAGQPANAVIDPRIAYARWSLEDENATWTAFSMLSDILNDVAPGWRFGEGSDSSALDAIDGGLAVQDLSTRGSHEGAVAKALQYVPGWDIYQALDGQIVLYDTRNNSEEARLAKLGAVHINTGYVGKVDRSFLRPPRVNVYIERELEVRFDFKEGDRSSGDLRTLDNVAPSPDFKLDASDRVGTVPITTGEYHPVGDIDWKGLLNFWHDDPVSGRPPLTLAHVRLMAPAGMTRIMAMYGIDAEGTQNIVWQRRVAALKAHWRTTYRIVQRYMDRIRTVRASRVGVPNPQTGSRAPAPVFVDYTIRPTARGLVAKNSHNLDKGFEILGYGEALTETNTAGGPFAVRVVDQDQGIITIEPRVDPWGNQAAVIMGRLTLTPTMDIRERNRLSNKDAARVLGLWQNGSFRDSFKLATILTVTQGAPNGLGRYHKEVVEREDVSDLIPGEIGEALGPEYSVVISSGLMTAMFAWSDEPGRAEEIETAFKDGGQISKDLLVNQEHVESVAKAAAARVYSALLDRHEGSQSMPLQPTEPTGSLRDVVYTVTPDGGVGAFVSLPPMIQPLDILTYLPESTRKVVQRLAVP